MLYNLLKKSGAFCKRALMLCTMLVACLNLFAFDFGVDGIYYNKLSNNEVEASYSNNDLSGSLIIPEKVTYKGVEYSVTSIGESAFRWCSSLTSITIPNSVTSIGEYAFCACSALTSVSLGNSVNSIGEYAFERCKSLTSATIGNSVISIGSNAFEHCTSMTSVTIGNSVTSIGSGAFNDCSSLTSVIIPNSVISIGSNAFTQCTSMTSVTIGNSVTTIESCAFYACSLLKSIISLAVVPPVCGGGVFYEFNQSECELHVPQGSVEAYKAAEQWKDFSMIYGDATAVEAIEAEGAEPAEIYNLQGVRVGNTTDCLPRGIYIIRRGASVSKLKI